MTKNFCFPPFKGQLFKQLPLFLCSLTCLNKSGRGRRLRPENSIIPRAAKFVNRQFAQILKEKNPIF
jgi:hypothetical protein